MKHHSEKVKDLTVRDSLQNQFYVDKLVQSFLSKESAITVYQKLKSACNDAGLDLREWSSNGPKIVNHFSPRDQNCNDTVKVLGYLCNCQTDMLSLKPFNYRSCNTKREIHSQFSSLYDPLGIFAPLTVRGKMLLRDLHRAQLS